MCYLRGILMVSFFTAIHSIVYASEPLNIDGSTGVKPLIESLVSSYRKVDSSLSISVGPGMKPNLRADALLSGKIDIAMASHGIDIEQFTALGLQVHKIAKVAIVMGVHDDVDISSINHADLCNIYSGKVRNWQSIGGNNLRIVPFTRPFDEVDAEVLQEQVPCFSELQLTDIVQVREKSGQMARAIANTSGSIGMTTLIRVAQSDSKIKALAFDGIEPTTNNLLAGRYSLTRDMFLITHQNPSQEVATFLNYINGERGAEVILSNNAIPVKDTRN